jgi:hypothetical protein
MLKIIASLFIVALLGGCNQNNVKEALDHLSQDCDRHYTFSASTGGVGGIGGSLTLAGTADCTHSGGATQTGKPVPPAAVTKPVAPPEH